MYDKQSTTRDPKPRPFPTTHMTHKEKYQRIKLAADARTLDDIIEFTNWAIQRVSKRKPRGQAGRTTRRFALDAFKRINRITKEARKY